MKTLVFFRRPLVPVFWPSIGFVGIVFTWTPCECTHVTIWPRRCRGISYRSEELAVGSRTCTVLVAAIGATEYLLLGVLVRLSCCRWQGVCDLRKSTPGEEGHVPCTPSPT